MEQHRVRDLQEDSVRPHRHRRQRQSGPSHADMEGRHRRGQVRGVPRPQPERRVHQVFHRHRHVLYQHILHRGRQHLLLQGPRPEIRRHGRRVEQHRVRDLPRRLDRHTVCPHRHRRQRQSGPPHADMEGRHRRGQVRGVPRPQPERRVHQVFHRHRHVLYQHILHRGRQHLLLQGSRSGCQRHGGRMEQHRVRDLPRRLDRNSVRSHRHRQQRQPGPSHAEMESRLRRGQVRDLPLLQP